jgi:hypothetical protein
MELEQRRAQEKAAADAAALQAKKDRAAARRARGSIILEGHDLMGGGRRVEHSVSQRMQALGLALADEAGFTHGDVDAASLIDVLMRRCGMAGACFCCCVEGVSRVNGWQQARRWRGRASQDSQGEEGLR